MAIADIAVYFQLHFQPSQKLQREILYVSRPPHGCHVAISTYGHGEPGSIHGLPWLQWVRTG